MGSEALESIRGCGRICRELYICLRFIGVEGDKRIQGWPSFMWRRGEEMRVRVRKDN